MNSGQNLVHLKKNKKNLEYLKFENQATKNKNYQKKSKRNWQWKWFVNTSLKVFHILLLLHPLLTTVYTINEREWETRTYTIHQTLRFCFYRLVKHSINIQKGVFWMSARCDVLLMFKKFFGMQLCFTTFYFVSNVVD